MTREQWWRSFVKVMRQMPESAELLVRGAAIDLYPVGSLRAHLDRNTGFGMGDSPLESLRHARVHPYGEGD